MFFPYIWQEWYKEEKYNMGVAWYKNRKGNDIEKMKNDLMAEGEIENNSLFYMNNYTWLRVDDSFEDLIRLKILHLQ